MQRQVASPFLADLGLICWCACRDSNFHRVREFRVPAYFDFFTGIKTQTNAAIGANKKYDRNIKLGL
jgi:hypothetical protein